uniref:Aspartyl/asparaginy/proline hydroxylase domain-containing protein n=1 Tax=Ditylum brightwellii TaxID=49249 RepID=A0A7S1YTR1_9STRA|mmetsp:Transcript_17546/g.26133  ORF Transcript_17546/g.26133 Transcript_17546/m.26133 type:complete len:664 (+) Transcript_17546:190-2181(+)
MSTSKDEIKQQHLLAEKIVSTNSKPCAPLVNRGEIPLTWKQHPTVNDPFYAEQKAKEEGGEEKKETTSDNVVSMNEIDITLHECKINDQHDPACCISSRGVVDVSPLAALVEEGHNDDAPPPPSKTRNNKTAIAATNKIKSITNLWDVNNAKINNVQITRPAHDAWGIKKIALIFCDDFLHNVYEMPWWHDVSTTKSMSAQKQPKLTVADQMRKAFEPILDALNIKPNRLVRCLFAAMPPGATIPTHHDTGLWVRHTHRVHIPIIVEDPNCILFQCGPTEDTMIRVACVPGHVFEMNNQAKHGVSNCDPTEHRVHVILDYVDEDFVIPNRIKLQANETLLQTRRSIDRTLDAGKRPTPSYFILGAQKSGTTSLYDYLNQHPLIVRAKRRETHCLDWRWDDSLKTTKARQEHCLSFFYAKELHKHPSLLTGDSTPSYLLDSKQCIERMKEVFPHDLRFFVCCRDPVKRARSQFAMVTSLDGTPEQIKARGKEWLNKTFEDVVLHDIQNMKEDGLIPYWNMETQTIDLDIFHSFIDTKEENDAWLKYLKRIPMDTGSHSLISRGLYALQIKPWIKAYDMEQFCFFKLEDWKKEDGVKRCVQRAFDHLGLPQFEVEDESAKNTRSYEFKEEDVGKMLQRFYEPHNGRLCKILDGEEWKDPWPYNSE